MKTRRIVVFMFLLVASLTLGIGYAAVSKHLQISGISSVKSPTAEDFDVTFTQVNDPVNTESASGVKVTSNDIQASDAHVVILSLGGFKELNDEITLTYDVSYSVKEEGINAKLSTPAAAFVTETNASYFAVTCSFDKTVLTSADDTAVLTVNVKLVKVPTDDVTADYKITFNADAVTAE